MDTSNRPSFGKLWKNFEEFKTFMNLPDVIYGCLCDFKEKATEISNEIRQKYLVTTACELELTDPEIIESWLRKLNVSETEICGQYPFPIMPPFFYYDPANTFLDIENATEKPFYSVMNERMFCTWCNKDHYYDECYQEPYSMQTSEGNDLYVPIRCPQGHPVFKLVLAKFHGNK